jgi:hypothetical protein
MPGRRNRHDSRHYFPVIFDENQGVVIGQKVIIRAAEVVLPVLSRSFRDARQIRPVVVVDSADGDPCVGVKAIATGELLPAAFQYGHISSYISDSHSTSYPEKWSGRRDSNPRPLEPHSSALPSCATARRQRKRKMRRQSVIFKQENIQG